MCKVRFELTLLPNPVFETSASASSATCTYQCPAGRMTSSGRQLCDDRSGTKTRCSTIELTEQNADIQTRTETPVTRLLVVFKTTALPIRLISAKKYRLPCAFTQDKRFKIYVSGCLLLPFTTAPHPSSQYSFQALSYLNTQS